MTPAELRRPRPRPAPERKQALLLQAEVRRSIRRFFDRRGFLEVTTPLLSAGADPAPHTESLKTRVSFPGGTALELYLPTSPELFMKRLVAEGFGKIYQLCPFFRDGEVGPLHQPHFTGLEWYQPAKGLHALMDFTEGLVRGVARHLKRAGLLHPAVAFVLNQRYRRYTVRQACRTLGGIELPPDFNPEGVRAALESRGVRTAPDDELGDLVHRLLLERVEPRLARKGAAFLYHYPAEMAALARLSLGRPWLAERFELYLGGVEIANGYHELCDFDEQQRRFQAQLEQRRRLGRETPQIDREFMQALQRGLPDCCGCALGVDRLAMVLGGHRELEQILPFTLREPQS